MAEALRYLHTAGLAIGLLAVALLLACGYTSWRDWLHDRRDAQRQQAADADEFLNPND